MQFDSLADFFAMGGYGFYVWLSFGSCALIMVGIWLNSVLAHRNTLEQVAAQIKREERIERARQEQAV